MVERYDFLVNRYYATEDGRVFRGKETLISDMKPDARGNIEVRLKDDYGIVRRFKVHQVIGQTLKPHGIKNGHSIDHINKENRLDNSKSNLRWGSRKVQFSNRENVAYKQKRIKCLTNGRTYQSCQHAERDLNLVQNTVSRVARGERKSIHGYTFAFTI
jgi:hypothetical protein